MKHIKQSTRRRCLACVLGGLAAALSVFAALTARRGPEAGPIPEVLVRASEQSTLPEVVVQARRPDGLLPEIQVRAASPKAFASALPDGRELN
jgi:hypothetical protein